MKKNNFSQNFKEIFANRKFQMTFSAIACAFVISFSVIGFSRIDISGTSMMASVTSLQTASGEKVEFDADIALIIDSTMNLIAGKNMEKVDVLEGIIVYNPTEPLVLSSSDSHIKLTKESEWMYRFHIDFSSKNVLQGETLAKIIFDSLPKSPLTLLDTQFVSEGERYNITNTVE